MENPEFPPRLFSKGNEPSPLKSIDYNSGETKLMTALEEALTQDEWEEILNSKLGVFLKFSQLDFGWASRLVHYILGMQLVCKKKFEIWSLVGLIPIRFSLNVEHITGLNCEYMDNLEDLVVEITDEMKDFWERLGVNPDGSGKLLPAGSFEYYTGAAPTYCVSNKTWGYDVDDMYSMLHITDDHWVAMWISIPMKHIVIWDSHANTHASDIQIEAAVTPITVLVPYILRECAPAEDRINLTYDPFTWERIKGHLIPQNKQSGDCGVYCLKYLECHALGMPFPKTLCDANIKNIRDKLAAEIFDETGVTGTEKYEYPWLDVYEVIFRTMVWLYV
ncbi:hypothetical protein EUTSA_v10000500mg [Eutrema salsugineum]|uniref:Ubiquitin-like protease family profile domain-containing protein n=1 Tax=Eutrema salsugineum TaxID=72664 RepID=V4L7B6_EUTSA|nr:hypothetical protein EUTSA_v10000500mg [Eutrema salsugineum]